MLLSIIPPILAGVLAAASLIVARKPNAKELIDKLVPYQGWIGIVVFIWGFIDLISNVSALGMLMSAIPLTGIALIATWILEILVGFLLGFGLISKYALSKNEQAMAKGQAIRAKLAVFQGPLGIALIASSLFLLVRAYIWTGIG